MNCPLANLPFPVDQDRVGRFGEFRGGSRTPRAPERAETKMAQPSIRCEIRTLGETLIEEGRGMPSRLPILARILIPEEVEIWEGIHTVRSCFVLYVWART